LGRLGDGASGQADLTSLEASVVRAVLRGQHAPEVTELLLVTALSHAISPATPTVAFPIEGIVAVRSAVMPANGPGKPMSLPALPIARPHLIMQNLKTQSTTTRKDQ